MKFHEHSLPLHWLGVLSGPAVVVVIIGVKTAFVDDVSVGAISPDVSVVVNDEV